MSASNPKIEPIHDHALAIKVDGLDSDMREVKDSILGLDVKIEKAVTDLAREVRAAIESLRTQFADRQRTPWGVLISGAGFTVTVIVLFGSQALSPLQADIKALKEEIVPRKEIDYRAENANRRFQAIELDIRTIETARYNELRERLRDVENENRELKRGTNR